MFIYKAMTVLTKDSSVSFPLPDNRLHCVLSLAQEGRHVLLRAQVVNGARALEGDVHRASTMDDMMTFLRDERNEAQVRFAIRQLWDRMEGRT